MLYLLLAVILGPLAYKIPYISLPLIALIIYITHKRKDKIIICAFVFISLFSFIRVLITSNIKYNSSITISGVVEKRSDNYLVINSIKGRFYLSMYDNTFEQGDILKVSGSLKKIKMHAIESTFDFEKYLNNTGCYYEIFNYKYEIIYARVLRPNKIINVIKNLYPSDVYSTIISISFNKYDDNAIKNDALLYLMHSSGLHYIMLINFIMQIIRIFRINKKYRFIGYLVLTPYFLLVNSFSLKRILLLKAIDYVINSKKINQIKSRDCIYFFLALLDPYLVFQTKYYVPLLYSFLYSKFQKFTDKNLIKILTLNFILFIGISLIVFRNYELNLLSSLIRMLFMFFNVFIILCSTLSIYINTPIKLLNPIIRGYNTFLNSKFISFFNINVGYMNAIVTILLIVSIAIFLYSLSIRFQLLSRMSIISVFGIIVISSLPIINYVSESVTFIDVGQGDCVLIEKRNNYALIDTGGSLSFDIANNCLMPYFKKRHISKIDKVFITHNDYDHNGALNELTKLISINEIVTSFDIIDWNNVIFKNLNKKRYDNDNDNSLVIYFKLLNYKFLLMGDASKKVELEIIKKDSLQVDVIKLGHHGSNSSTHEEFISKIRPKEAIISVGYQNKYGHPNKEVLEILEKYQVKIRRTDIEGTICYKKLYI